jgi:hypothetical protein
MIDAAQLDAMRTVQNLTLVERGDVQRFTEASDGMGGSEQVWHTVGTHPCRVAPALRQPEVALVAGRGSENMGWRVTWPAETDILIGDRIRVAMRGFEVLGVLAPKTLETACVTICVEREVTILEDAGATGLDFSVASNSMYLALF